MNRSYHAIVSGAGPSGCAFAYHLASAGLSVLILEKSALPRNKLCAGGVPGKALKDPPGAGFIEKAIPVSRYSFTFRGKQPSSGVIPAGKLYSVERSEFDCHLALAAVGAGAVLKESCALIDASQDEEGVSVTTSSGVRFSAQFLIGADGGFSTVSRLLGFEGKQKNYGLCGFFRLPPPDRTFQNRVHLDLDFFRGGVTGILPKQDCLWVGAYTPYRKSLKELESETRLFIEKMGMPGKAGQFLGLRIPLYQKGMQLQKGRVLLVGEAAQLVNPLSGEGILPAMESGRICADEIIKAVSEGKLYDGYSARVHREIGGELEIAGHFARIAFAFPNLAYHGMIRVVPDALKIMNCEMSYGDFLARLKNKIKRKILGGGRV